MYLDKKFHKIIVKKSDLKMIAVKPLFSEPSNEANYIVVPLSKNKPNMDVALYEKCIHEEWFWSCIEVNYRINVDPFLPDYAIRTENNIDETNMLSFHSQPPISPKVKFLSNFC